MNKSSYDQMIDKIRELSIDDFAKRLGGGAQIGSPEYMKCYAELERRKYLQKEKDITVNERIIIINKWHAIAMGALTAVLIIITIYDIFFK